MNQIPTSGLLVEAVRCSDNAVIVSQLTQPGIIFNYHLRYEDEDDGQPGGEFQGNLTPIPAFMRVSYPGCPTPLILSCDEIAAGYEATIDGKLTLYKHRDRAMRRAGWGTSTSGASHEQRVAGGQSAAVAASTRGPLSYPAPEAGPRSLPPTPTRPVATASRPPSATRTEPASRPLDIPSRQGTRGADGTFDVLYTGTKPITTVDFCLVNSPVIDTDTDGLPDDWETRYGLNPNSAADAGIDSATPTV